MPNFPFTQAGTASLATKGLLKSKFSFNGIVTNLEKTLSTINQVVPLYNQIKPLVSNSKTLFKVFKSVKSETKSNKNKKPNFDPNIINVEVKPTTISEPIKKSKDEEYNIFTNINTPNKPYFSN